MCPVIDGEQKMNSKVSLEVPWLIKSCKVTSIFKMLPFLLVLSFLLCLYGIGLLPSSLEFLWDFFLFLFNLFCVLHVSCNYSVYSHLPPFLCPYTPQIKQNLREGKKKKNGKNWRSHYGSLVWHSESCSKPF